MYKLKNNVNSYLIAIIPFRSHDEVDGEREPVQQDVAGVAGGVDSGRRRRRRAHLPVPDGARDASPDARWQHDERTQRAAGPQNTRLPRPGWIAIDINLITINFDAGQSALNLVKSNLLRHNCNSTVEMTVNVAIN